MTRAARIGISLVVLVGAGRLLYAGAADHTAADRATGGLVVAHSARMGAPLPPEPSDSLPPLPPVLSPVRFFRELLAMNPAELKLALSNRTPEKRALIVAKLREYAAMDADQRELRLQVTEMRWYLQPLLVVPMTNRVELLMSLPGRNRKLVEDRLKEWDKLSSEVQKELLAHQNTIAYLTELQGLTDEQRRNVVQSLSPVQREKLQAGIEQLNSVPEDQRRKMISRFNQFFELTSEEKAKALQTLSSTERQQIEKTIKTFGTLSPDQRERCMRGIEKFTSLSLAERQQFLQNAERWQSLTPKQRQAWRDLVNRLPPSSPPPLPPEFPPEPPSRPSAHAIPVLVTNGS